MNNSPIRPTDCFKHYTLDQDKVCSPVETVTRFKERLKEVNLDILQEVRRIDNGRLDIPVYFSVCGKDAKAVIGNKKQMGKGSSPEQSQASACMELAERFSFFSFKKNEDNFITDTYANLKKAGQPLLPLVRLLLSVHDEQTDIATLERLIEDIPIQWVWATNLNSGEVLLVPFSWFYAINEFNGPSAGNTYEEAILQGISELVERHVCSVVNHKQLATPAINPDSVTDPVARELIDKFAKNGIDLYLNDFTLDTGIPTVGALAIDRNTFPDSSEIVYTAGTTPDPEKALIRAITEVAQLAGDFNTHANYVASGLPKPLSMDEVRYLTETETTISIHDMPQLSDNNMRVEIDRCLAALSRLGLEVLVVNTMHEKLQIPTIYTIIPGCHFRERSMINNVGLFAAKLVTERIPAPEDQLIQLKKMQTYLPDAYFLEYYLGKNMQAQGEFAAAVAHLERALTLRPEEEDIPYIYSHLGDCLKDMGEYAKAITALQKGAAYDEDRPDIHNLLGFCHFKLSDYQTAIGHFRRTVELNPASAIDYANLGVNYRRLGKSDEASRYFELALNLDPNIEFAKTNLAELSAAN
ncbi:MAG: YcaO-like family protein [Desulfobulbaceae bacterium]|nr:YcaO-like family protein [Desulfobulbaceae bacterium]HIJ89847.1 tetratricopeptide repeat protein [Deltaproteobacteria bacterium]